MRIDLRHRCPRCGVLKPEPRGTRTKERAAEFERYAPYCSYHCQEWHKTEQAYEHLRRCDEQEGR